MVTIGRSGSIRRALAFVVAVLMAVTLTGGPADACFASSTVSTNRTFVGFGAVPVGTDAPLEAVRVGNRTDEVVYVYAVNISAGFSIEGVGCFDGPLLPGESCSIDLGAQPSRLGRIGGHLAIQYCFISDPLCPGAEPGSVRALEVRLRVTGV